MKRVLIGGLYPSTSYVTGQYVTYRDLLSEICEVVVESNDFDFDIDLFVCVDFKKQDVEKAKQKGLSGRKALLIRQEPKIVWPMNYSKEAENFFGSILNIGNFSQNSTSDFWPQNLNPNMNVKLDHNRNQKQVLLLNSNRCSLLKGELYSLRKKTAKKFPRIDLYGRDWDLSFLSKLKIAASSLKIVVTSGNFPSLKSILVWLSKAPTSFGGVVNKEELMASYRYSLVIENELTYVSEKLFDSFKAGCIPIYVGPNLADYGIPRNLVVYADPNLNSIEVALEELMKIDYANWHQEMSTWLLEQSTLEKWSYVNFGQRIQEFVTKLLD